MGDPWRECRYNSLSIAPLLSLADQYDQKFESLWQITALHSCCYETLFKIITFAIFNQSK